MAFESQGPFRNQSVALAHMAAHRTDTIRSSIFRISILNDSLWCTHGANNRSHGRLCDADDCGDLLHLGCPGVAAMMGVFAWLPFKGPGSFVGKFVFSHVEFSPTPTKATAGSPSEALVPLMLRRDFDANIFLLVLLFVLVVYILLSFGLNFLTSHWRAFSVDCNPRHIRSNRVHLFCNCISDYSDDELIDC